MLYFVTMNHEKEERRRKRILYESIRTVVGTLLLLAISLLTFAWFHHARPKERMSAGLLTATPTPALSQVANKPDATPTPFVEADAPPSTPEPTPVYVPWIEKYADQFTESILSDEQGYSSPDLAVHITKVQYGKAKTAMYYLADIYLTDVFQFETVLAKDRFGSGLRESWDIQRRGDARTGVLVCEGRSAAGGSGLRRGSSGLRAGRMRRFGIRCSCHHGGGDGSRNGSGRN